MKKIIAILITFSIILSLGFAMIACSASDTVAFDSGEAMVIAHRGLSGIEVENTDQAFIAAGERSYYGIEADLRRTSDGKFIICHDPDLKRISGRDIDVESSTLADLQSIPLFNKKGKSDSEICLTTLESYISICKSYDKQAILELKSDFTSQELSAAVKIISDLDYIDRVTFISFNYDNLTCVRELLPEQSAQYLCSDITDEVIERLIRDRIDAAIKYTSLRKKDLDRLHAAGLKVNCWTVDTVIVAKQLCKLGVDYITTNILE